MAVLKKIKFGTGTATPIARTVLTAKSGGVMSVAAPDGVSNGIDENVDYQYELDVNVDGTTLVKNTTTGDNPVTQLAVGTVPAAQVSVADTDSVFTAQNVETALKELKDDIASVGGAAKSYTIIKETSKTQGATLDVNVLEQYKLQQTVNGTDSIVGETIKIYKDKNLKSVALNGQSLDFTYILADGTESTVGVDVSTFLAESEFADGLQVNNHVVSVNAGNGLGINSTSKAVEVVVDQTSETFLTVGANGIKLDGVQDAIDDAIVALDNTDTAVGGQVVTAVSTANGKADPTKANLAGITLGGFTQDTTATGDISASDTLGAALNKLENGIDAAKQAAAAGHGAVAKDANANHLTLTESTNTTTGQKTYTIGESHIASDTDLDAEVTRAKAAETAIDSAIGLTKASSGEDRTYTNTGEYIGKGQTNTVASDIAALDTKLKEVADGLAAVQYKVTNTTLEFFGISEKTA